MLEEKKRLAEEIEKAKTELEDVFFGDSDSAGGWELEQTAKRKTRRLKIIDRAELPHVETYLKRLEELSKNTKLEQAHSELTKERQALAEAKNVLQAQLAAIKSREHIMEALGIPPLSAVDLSFRHLKPGVALISYERQTVKSIDEIKFAERSCTCQQTIGETLKAKKELREACSLRFSTIKKPGQVSYPLVGKVAG